MKSAPRSCPVAGCFKPHPGDQVMCRSHWLKVPKPLRDEVWRLYRKWLGETPHTVATALLLKEAQQQAIAAVS